ncbi:MAG: GTPase Era [Coriobacteriales bacterium]|jgi:GTP-binding protein Era|nr:GTPase Era [Coriobacteriales bacterium]
MTHELQQFSKETPFCSGFVTLVGRPNAGKSSLINAVIGTKVAIISNTPQTTRHRFRAVYNNASYQLVLVDTPGIHKPHDALGEELNHSAAKAFEAVDVIAFVLDASKPFGTGDEWVLHAISRSPARKLLVISKTDLVDAATIEQQRVAASAEFTFDATVALSALTGAHVDEFITTASAFLPEGPRWFPLDTTTDQPLEVIIAEFIREKILNATFDEVPHAVGVQVEELSFDKKRNLHSIYATIFVERDSQKGILIGHQGEKIKQVGTLARKELDRFLDTRVYLDLRVKVRKGWRKDANQIRRFGYGEGA